MSDLSVQSFASRALLDSQLATDVASALATAVANKGEAFLVVSGGSTPLHFFAELSKKKLPWEKISITLADERWVPADHPDSNEKLLRDTLLINEAVNARFIPLKNTAADARDGEAELEKALAELPTFDVVILGMGADGHTASLFPGAEALAEGLDVRSEKSCIAVQPLTAPHQRMSLTLPRLLNTEQLIIHITGNEKKAVLNKAGKDNDPESLPIAAVLNQRQVAVTLYWSE